MDFLESVIKKYAERFNLDYSLTLEGDRLTFTDNTIDLEIGFLSDPNNPGQFVSFVYSGGDFVKCKAIPDIEALFTVINSYS